VLGVPSAVLGTRDVFFLVPLDVGLG